MGFRRAEPNMYEVTNKAKGHTYHVRFTRQNGSLFASCDCPAGIRHGRSTLVRKLLRRGGHARRPAPAGKAARAAQMPLGL
jgi:hypothetical protein